MQKWEYLHIEQERTYKITLRGVKFDPFSPTIDLENLGNSGWELVLVVAMSSPNDIHYSGTTTNLLWTFKRSK